MSVCDLPSVLEEGQEGKVTSELVNTKEIENRWRVGELPVFVNFNLILPLLLLISTSVYVSVWVRTFVCLNRIFEARPEVCLTPALM